MGWRNGQHLRKEGYHAHWTRIFLHWKCNVRGCSEYRVSISDTFSVNEFVALGIQKLTSFII